MAPTVEPVSIALELGEGPYWDEETQTLYFVDIFKHTLHSYNPKTNEHHIVDIDSEGKTVSLVIKVKGQKNQFVITVKHSLATVQWDGVSSETLKPEYLLEVERGELSAGINDGKCDPSHRIWAGTMGSVLDDGQYEPGKGSLYSIEKNKTVKKHLTKVGISNGLAWSLDKKRFYYNDSLKYRVSGYDYEDSTGTITNEQTVFCFKENNIEGMPDGMTIDTEGMIWVACFGGAQVLRVNPNTGELLQTLKIPSHQTTSVAFGGPNFEDLYVTSAHIRLSKELQDKYPHNGKTFRITGLGIRGIPSVPIEL